MLRINLVWMQPSLGPKAPEESYPSTIRQGDKIREPATPTLDALSESKISERSLGMSYRDYATVRSLRFPARPRTLLQSILQTAGTGRSG